MRLITISLLFASALATALALFSAYGAWRIQRDYPPVGQFVEAAGLPMHYVDRGSGPPVVLLHGASTSLMDFTASLLPPLTYSHRVLAFDRPGHGYSDRPAGAWPSPAEQADYLHAALAKLGIRRPLLVGHSWSGSLVLAYLLHYPDNAAGGVLLAGGSHPWEGGVAWSVDIGQVPLLGRIFAHTLVYPAGQLLLEGAVSEVFRPEAPPPDYVRRTGVELVLRPGNYFSNAEDVGRLSEFLRVQSRDYAALRQPLLLIHGTEDHIVPAWNHTDRLIEILPDAEVVRLEGVGHGLHHTQTERVAGLISEFSRRVQAETPTRDSGW